MHLSRQARIAHTTEWHERLMQETSATTQTYHDEKYVAICTGVFDGVSEPDVVTCLYTNHTSKVVSETDKFQCVYDCCS